jgi:hypothetical protein
VTAGFSVLVRTDEGELWDVMFTVTQGPQTGVAGQQQQIRRQGSWLVTDEGPTVPYGFLEAEAPEAVWHHALREIQAELEGN